jgi:Kef-type K+ transport system membrane component KefB
MKLIFFLAVVYFVTLVLGRALEQVRIPWVFAPLLFGLALAVSNPFEQVTGSEPFAFLGELGLLFFLFVVGLEIDLERLRTRRWFTAKAAGVLLILEEVAGTIFIHTVFGTPWTIAAVVALSFATVGEALLLPILEEFDLLSTDLGQTILGIGIVDDTVEIVLIAVASILVGLEAGGTTVTIGGALLALGAAFLAAYAIQFLPADRLGFSFSRTKMSEGALFVLVLFIVFSFIELASIAGAGPIGTVLAGIAVRNFVPVERFEQVETEIKAVAYGFFGPLFFCWTALDIDVSAVIAGPLAVLGIMVLVVSMKLLGSLLVARPTFGTRGAIFMGVALSVKFSVSIAIVKLLYENGVIEGPLYSALIAANAGFIVVPFVLSVLISKWAIIPEKAGVAGVLR